MKRYFLVLILILISIKIYAISEFTNRLNGFSAFKYYQRPEIGDKSIMWVALNENMKIYNLTLGGTVYTYRSFLEPKVYQKTPGSLDVKFIYPEESKDQYLFLNKFYMSLDLFKEFWTYLRVGNINIEQEKFNFIIYGIEPENVESYMLPYSVSEFGMLAGVKTGGVIKNIYKNDFLKWNAYIVSSFNDGSDTFSKVFKDCQVKKFIPDAVGGDMSISFINNITFRFFGIQSRVFPEDELIKYDYIQNNYNIGVDYFNRHIKIGAIYSMLENKDIISTQTNEVKKRGDFFRGNISFSAFNFDWNFTYYRPSEGYAPVHGDPFVDEVLEKRFIEKEVLLKSEVDRSFNNFDVSFILFKDFQDKSVYTNTTIYRLKTVGNFFRFRAIGDFHLWQQYFEDSENEFFVSDLKLILFAGLGLSMSIQFKFFNDVINDFSLYKTMQYFTIDYRYIENLKFRFEYKVTEPNIRESINDWEVYQYIDNYIRFDVVYKFELL